MSRTLENSQPRISQVVSMGREVGTPAPVHAAGEGHRAGMQEVPQASQGLRLQAEAQGAFAGQPAQRSAGLGARCLGAAGLV